MNRSFTLAVASLFITGMLGASAAPGLKDDKSDHKKLEGKWTIETWVQLGQNIKVVGTWEFKGEGYNLDQGFNIEDGKIKLDAGKKPPTIDMEITGGSCKGKDQLGIYKIDGETLLLCLAWPDAKDRPTDFTSTMDNRWILITLKRVKEDK